MHPVSEAVDQWHWGRNKHEISATLQRLREIDPAHWLIAELEEKLKELEASEKTDP